jgi:hypothetical protein
MPKFSARSGAGEAKFWILAPEPRSSRPAFAGRRVSFLASLSAFR